MTVTAIALEEASNADVKESMKDARAPVGIAQFQ